MTKAEKRSKIQADKSKRHEQLEKSGRTMEQVLKGKQETARASREVRRSTTLEGAKRLEDAIRKAAKASDAEFHKQNSILEKKITDCKKAEQDLKEKTTNARHDAGRSRQAAERIKETPQAKSQALVAEKIAVEDGHWTDERKHEQEKDRRNSETRRSRQQNTLNGTRLAF